MIDWSYDPVAADKLWTEAGWPKEKRGEWTMDFMSWLGNKPRLDYLPILQEAMRKMGFKANVDLIDNSLINDYLSGPGPARQRLDTMVPYGARGPTRRACPSCQTQPPRPTPASGAAPIRGVRFRRQSS